MQISPIPPVSPADLLGQPASAARNLLGRLAQAVQLPGRIFGEGLGAASAAGGTLTPELIRGVLLEMGAGAAEANVALAVALTQAGLPLTLTTLSQASTALASAPGTSPEAYALAKSLALPTTPAALRAMTAVLSAPSGRLPGAPAALPEQVTAWLGLALDAGTPPEALARGLREMLLQVGRSTENRVLRMQEGPLPVADLRISLLRLAEGSSDRGLRQSADGLASLVEGQQMLNQAALTAHGHSPPLPLYFALPMAFDGVPGFAEFHLRLPAETKQNDEDTENEDSDTDLRVTVRLSPPRLGRLQVDLTGRMSGTLNCRFGAEKPAAARLLAKQTGMLAAALSDAGWETCDVTCRVQADWPPLHHGGAAIAAPRPYLDRHI